MASSVTAMVSSRGISTSRVTVSVMPQKSHSPRMYASGSPSRTRATDSRSVRTACSSAYTCRPAISSAAGSPEALQTSSRATWEASAPRVSNSSLRIS